MAGGFRLRGARAAIPSISPSGSYAGTPLTSGRPAFITRTGAMCAARWMQESELRFHQDLVIGVEAEALGGIAYVDFWFEGGTARATRSVYTDTHPRTGLARSRVGFWVKLLHSDSWSGVGNLARVFATAHANDPTIQDRVIGWWSGFNQDGATSGGDSGYSLPAEYLAIPGNDAGIVGLQFDTPMRLHPRTTASGPYDWYANVTLGGTLYTATHTAANPSVYLTLNDASQALAAAINAGGTVENGCITITVAGSYDPGEPSTVVPGVMMSRITASAAATLYRGASFDPLNTSNTAWRYAPAVSLTEFYGPNLTLDRKNWTQIQVPYNRGPVLRGCYVTNSIGTNHTNYWMGREAAPWKVVNWNSGFPLPVVYDGVDFTYAEPTPGFRAMIGCTLYKGTILGLDAIALMKDCYAHLSEQSYYLADRAMLRVRSTVASSVLSKSSNNLFTISDANGSATFSVPGANGEFPATSGNQANFTMAALVAWIGGRTGWTASALDTTIGCWALFGTEDPGNGSVNVTSTDQDVHGQVNNHSELLHWHWGENGIVAESYMRDCSWTTDVLNIEQNKGQVRDVIVRNSLFTISTALAGSMSSTGSSMGGSHTFVIGCVLDDDCRIGKDTDTPPADNFSGIFGCILRGQVTGFTSGSWPAANHGGRCENTIASTATNVHPGVVATLANYSAFTALFQDFTNGDMRPPASGVVASHLFATSTYKNIYDKSLTVRASNDAIGAYALAAPAPSWPY